MKPLYYPQGIHPPQIISLHSEFNTNKDTSSEFSSKKQPLTVFRWPDRVTGEKFTTGKSEKIRPVMSLLPTTKNLTIKKEHIHVNLSAFTHLH